MLMFRLLILLMAGSGFLLVGGAPAGADTTVSARLKESNNSGVTGTATVTAADSGDLRVVINARGLVPGLPHAQHIHGSTAGGHFMCPSAQNDTDGDGLLTNEEATGEYGKVFLSLTTRGDTSPGSGLSVDRMPVADASGRLHYVRTIPADEVPDGLLRHLSEVHIVQHGIDVNNNGRYDVAGAGVSTFAENLGMAGVPEETTDPASCGVLTGAKAAMAPHGGPETGGGDQSMDPAFAGVGGLLLLGSLLTFFSMRRRVLRS